jgi:translation initiation factor 3 subunit C
MASRFWAGGSSSEEESDYSDVSDIETTNQQQRAASRWAVQSDSDSEEEVRVVRSAKDKAFEAMEKSCGAIKNYIKINDWSSILSEFDALAKSIEKSKNVISNSGYPKFYLRTMIQLEDFMNEKLKNKDSKMKKENSKALVRMKGKLKKNNEAIKKELDDFRANPDSSEEDVESSEDESDSESESEEVSSEEEIESEEDSDESEDEDSSEEDKVRNH